MPKGAPVVFEGHTLFYLYAEVGPYNAEKRAALISQRIARFARARDRSISSIIVENGDGVSTLTSAGDLILSIVDEDVTEKGDTRSKLAAEYSGTIRMAAEEARARWGRAEEEAKKRRDLDERRMLQKLETQERLRGLLLSVLSTILLGFCIHLITVLFAGLYNKIQKMESDGAVSLKIQKMEIMSSERIYGFLMLVAKAVRMILLLAIIYIYFNLILGLFPETRDLSELSANYAGGIFSRITKALLSYIPNLIFIVLIFVGARYILQFCDFIFSEIGRGDISVHGFHREWAESTGKIFKFFIIIIAVIIAFPFLPGYDSPAFKGISVFLGVLLSLGSSSAVSNIIAGVIITYTLAFKTGDRVKIGDSKGDVVEKTLLVTRIKTIKNEIISIPNSIVMSSQIINYSSSSQSENSSDSGLILYTTVTIGYDAPWRQVHQLLIDAALKTGNIQKEPAPFVLQTSLDDYYVSYQLNACTDKPEKMALTYSHLHQNIQDEFNKAGVEIMSPHYRAVRDGNEITIPADKRPDGYRTGGFRISGGDNDK